MASLDQILLLGDPRLNEPCDPVKPEEVLSLSPVIDTLSELVLLFRQKYGKGRAIAAPQIGILKRLVVMNIDKPVVLFNPVIHPLSPETFELWDDCMSFPNLLVKVKRFRSIEITFRDREWSEVKWKLEDDLSELMQHECDHLDGILATERAIDQRSFRMVR